MRLDKDIVKDFDIDRLFVRTADGAKVPVSEVADITLQTGPLQINRDATKRRIVIGVNVRNADIKQVVSDIQDTLDKNIKLKPGYYLNTAVSSRICRMPSTLSSLSFRWH